MRRLTGKYPVAPMRFTEFLLSYKKQKKTWRSLIVNLLYNANLLRHNKPLSRSPVFEPR
jgi:hypothetical protein